MTAHSVTGVILAGGRGQRMGGQDKGLLTVAGQPLIQFLCRALKPQVAHLLISANRNLKTYQDIGDCPVVPDVFGSFAGPLAGIASTMQVAQTPFIITVPCDSPLLAPDYVTVMVRRLVEVRCAEIALARDETRRQPMFALMPTRLSRGLIAYLESGQRKVDTWYSHYQVVEVGGWPGEMFLNVNTPHERERLKALLGPPAPPSSGIDLSMPIQNPT